MFLKEQILKEFVSKLTESAKITNAELLKIVKETKKEADKIRKLKTNLSKEDAAFLDTFVSYASTRDLKKMSAHMDRGETENREDLFRIVSSIIGKERATHFYKGNL